MRVTWGARVVVSLAVSLSSFVMSAAMSTPVMAQEAQPPPPPPSDGAYPAAAVVEAAPAHPRRMVSLTISPLHLTLPVLEVTGEYRILDKLGVAVIAGVGRYTDNDLSAAVYEAGAQVRYYVVGDFRHGMQLGAELLYVTLNNDQVTATAQGIAIGPFLGYKYTADIGFTVDVQLGFEYLGAHAKASSGGATATASDSTYIPLLNANVGWSF